MNEPVVAAPKTVKSVEKPNRAAKGKTSNQSPSGKRLAAQKTLDVSGAMNDSENFNSSAPGAIEHEQFFET